MALPKPQADQGASRGPGGMRRSYRRALIGGLAVAALTLAGLGAAAVIGPTELAERLLALRGQVDPLIGFSVLLLFTFVLFVSVLPFGSITVLVAGAVLGPGAGWVVFAALIASGVFLFELSSPDLQQKAVAEVIRHRRVAKWVSRLRHHGTLTVGVLRVAPVVPAAICSLAAAGLGIARRKFIIGTLAFGWIRPVALGVIGAQTDAALMLL